MNWHGGLKEGLKGKICFLAGRRCFQHGKKIRSISHLLSQLLNSSQNVYSFKSCAKLFFSFVHSHAADPLVTFTCNMNLASAVTVALGGVHSRAGVYSVCFHCLDTGDRRETSFTDFVSY